jgi:hypothetical protein
VNIHPLITQSGKEASHHLSSHAGHPDGTVSPTTAHSTRVQGLACLLQALALQQVGTIGDCFIVASNHTFMFTPSCSHLHVHNLVM